MRGGSVLDRDETFEDGSRSADDRRGFERRTFLRRSALAGGGAALMSTALAACGKTSEDTQGEGAGNFVATPKFKFVFVNHVTTNPFFTPTQYGAEDASALLRTTFQ